MNHKSNGAGHHTFDAKALSDLHLGYIERRWEVVAAVSWKGYLHRGRGALLFTSMPRVRCEPYTISNTEMA
jgi:hypothetical protein